MVWKYVLSLISSSANYGQLKIIDYLLQENLTYCKVISDMDRRIKLTDHDRISLSTKAKRLGIVIHDYATIVQPETLFKWYRTLIARKFDSSDTPRGVGRPPLAQEIVALIIRIASENEAWGYIKITDVVCSLGYTVSETSVRNVLIQHGLPPRGRRKALSTWHSFIKSHAQVIWATDFFTQEVFTKFGLITYYVLFFINIKSRKVVLGGISPNPNGQWILQIARNQTMCDGELEQAKYLIHDGDSKYCSAFDRMFKDAGVDTIKTPWHSPNLNPYAERFVRSIKEECLNHFIHIGENSLRRCIDEYLKHYHHERFHQGRNNEILFPDDRLQQSNIGIGEIVTESRLGGLLNYYYRKAS